MLFLIRYPEIGKEPHPEKSKLRKDIVDALLAGLDHPGITVDVGRIVLETPENATEILARIHGISSFSPCVRCSLNELEHTLVELARATVSAGQSFAVKVKRVGSHSFTSRSKAGELGLAVERAIPGATVKLKDPDVTISVEIRGDVAYVFSSVVPGVDVRSISASSASSAPEAKTFVVDAMLGTLATRMRILGFDAVCYHDTADSLILRKSKEEGRVILTQDRELARLGGESAYFVLGKRLDEQLREVLDRFGLEVSVDAIFSRCSLCNTVLERAPRESVIGRVPARVARTYEDFYRCPACGKIYWKGGHFDQILRSLEKARQPID